MATIYTNSCPVLWCARFEQTTFSNTSSNKTRLVRDGHELIKKEASLGLTLVKTKTLKTVEARQLSRFRIIYRLVLTYLFVVPDLYRYIYIYIYRYIDVKKPMLMSLQF